MEVDSRIDLELRIEKARELVIEYRDAMHYYRKKMIEGDEKLQIYRNAMDEFIKRHPEFNEELNKLPKCVLWPNLKMKAWPDTVIFIRSVKWLRNIEHIRRQSSGSCSRLANICS